MEEFKYYEPGIGLILEVDPEIGDRGGTSKLSAGP